jgi:16S rRNA (cytidine1402-2'-O)-methyltransferase
MLYIVATPIGNLKDITFRAIEVLKTVDVIACEDTRHSRVLLDHYAIGTLTTSFFSHNQFTKAHYLLEVLQEGKSVALISDAGTPGILDPGYHLINLAIKNDIPITVIPGPTAFVAGLVLSGKPAHEFTFIGFLPNRKIARQNRLKRLVCVEHTIVLYESCHRIIDTLEDIAEIFPDRQIVVTREVTKKFEEVKRDNPSAIAAFFKKQKPRGEFVVII